MSRHLTIITLSLLVMIGFAMPASSAPISDTLLQELDELLSHSQDFDRQKEQRISRLLHQARVSTAPEEKFWMLRNVVDEYSVYDSDSAFSYSEQAQQLADAIGNTTWTNDIHLLNSYTYASTGYIEKARDELMAIDDSHLTPSMRVNFLGQLLYLLTHEDQYRHVVTEKAVPTTARQALDSVVSIVTPDHPDYYYYIGYQALTGAQSTEMVRSVIKKLEVAMSNLQYDSRADARVAWVMSQLYGLVGDAEGKERYLTLSAMADLRTGNRDIASLEELAYIMYQQGNLERAYQYIDHCLTSAELYKNRVRALRVAALQKEISEAYQAKVAHLQQVERSYMVVLGVVVIILICSLLFILRQRRKLDRSNKELATVNDQLKQKIEELSSAYSQLAQKNQDVVRVSEELQQSNDRLADSDYIKEMCIGNIFSVCSSYINRIDEFRKNINRKIKAHQYEDIRRLTETTDLSQNELKDFYEQFDSIFLNIYPDFVEQFNTLLRPEEQIVPKEPRRLNTELRIYALIRLGITDSVRIASVLHYSPQTVYNKRLKMRSRTIVDKSSLVEHVKRLGRRQSKAAAAAMA